MATAGDKVIYRYLCPNKRCGHRANLAVGPGDFFFVCPGCSARHSIRRLMIYKRNSLIVWPLLLSQVSAWQKWNYVEEAVP